MKKTTLRERVRRHPLIDLLFNIRGNQKTLVFLEPLWGVPNALIAPFTAIYMRSLGVSNIQIGLALSIAMVAQVFCAFFGGLLTDKLGRKRVTILGDIIGWVIPCFIWASAKNYWFFLAAMMLNGFEQVNQTAWVCLLIEDAPDKHILNMWNWISIAGLLAVFFSPISGVLIRIHSLVAIMRVLYALFGICMIIKCLITWRYTKETGQGLKRIAETKNTGIAKVAAGYKELIPQIIRNGGTMRVLIIMVVLSVTALISNNFYSLYVTSTLRIPENLLAYFPIIRACIMLLFFFVIQNRLDRFKMKVPMALGLSLYMLCQLLVIFSPPRTIATLILYTLFEAVANALVFPRKELMAAVFIDKQERARIIALLTTFMLAISSPFGSIAGVLSKVDGRLPFVLSFLLFLFAFVTIVSMKQNPGSYADEPQ